MENFLTVLLVGLVSIVFVLIIVTQIFEIICSKKFYENLKEQHKQIMKNLKQDEERKKHRASTNKDK